MLAQIVWMLVSNALIVVLGLLVMELGFPLVGLALTAGLVGARLWYRGRPGKGYRLLPYLGEQRSGISIGFGSTGPLRVTRQEHPAWFGVLFALELAILAFLVWGVVQNPGVRESEALKDLVECRFGPGISERCFR